MPKELSDEEYEALQSRASAADAAAEAQRQRDAEWEQRLAQQQQQSRSEVAEILQSLASTPQQSQQPTSPTDDLDDDSLITGSVVKAREQRLAAQLRQESQQSSQQSTLAILHNQRQQNRQLALNNPSLKYLSKYIKEVDTLLDRVDPTSAADSRSYTEMYRYVLSLHHDEVLELEIKEREAKRAAADEDDDSEYEDDTDVAASAPQVTPRSTPPTTPQRAATPPTASSPQRNTRNAAPATAARRVKLTEDEKFVVNRYYNGDAKAYAADRDNGSDRDVLGFGERSML